MRDYEALLEPGCYYHVYNQGNARERIFFKGENYIYFLKKLDKYLDDYVEVFSYCLMSNHFHLLIRLKDERQILDKANENEELKSFIRRYQNADNLAGMIVSESFRRLFLSYSKSINKQQNRTGSLFRKNFRRLKIENDLYLKQVVLYIHRNPSHHGYKVDYHDYPWSSYSRLLEEKISKLRKSEVMGWFEDRKGFIEMHG